MRRSGSASSVNALPWKNRPPPKPLGPTAGLTERDVQMAGLQLCEAFSQNRLLVWAQGTGDTWELDLGP